jgi:hypothetical protein
MHPQAFRREFADEMLCIYEEAGSASFFADALVSLTRQWLLRSGGWKIAVVLAGALLQMSLGGILWLSIGRLPGQTGWSAEPHPEIAAMMRLVVLSAIGLLAGVIFLVFWWRRLARRIGA